MWLLGQAPLMTIRTCAKVADVVTDLFSTDSLTHTFLASLILMLLTHQLQGSVSMLHHLQQSVMDGYLVRSSGRAKCGDRGEIRGSLLLLLPLVVFKKKSWKSLSLCLGGG